MAINPTTATSDTSGALSAFQAPDLASESEAEVDSAAVWALMSALNIEGSGSGVHLPLLDEEDVEVALLELELAVAVAVVFSFSPSLMLSQSAASLE